MMPSSPREIARSYLHRGWRPLPVPHRSKNPGFEGWQNLKVTETDLPQYFNGKPQNIGVLLGAASGNLVDVDLDCDRAVALASHFLLTTCAIFGRQTRPRSHWLYYALIPRKVTFTDPVTGKRLLEILTNGQQAIFPGSTHKDTGEVVQWYEDGEPAHVSAPDLLQAAKHLAAATLLAEHWPQEGSRQDAALALAGGLLRARFTKDKAMQFIEAVCIAAKDEETPSRVRSAVHTAANLRHGTHVTGWPTLAKIVDKRIVDQVCEWLDIKANSHPEEAESSAPVAWPELLEGTLYGLPGQIVRTIAPHTEADPAAALIQMLAAFGNCIGRTAHFKAEADRHYLNLFNVSST